MERQFRLQTVLNYRRDIEEARQMELARLQAEEQTAQAQLKAFHDAERQGENDMARLQTETPLNVGALVQGQVYIEAVRMAVLMQNDVVAEISARVAAKRQELILAMQDRQALDRLKENHAKAYAAWADKVETSAIDDMVNARFHRREKIADPIE